MRIAVTGAAGFVGRHVVAELKRRSLPVVAVTHVQRLDDRSPDVTEVTLDLHDLPSNCFQLLGSPQLLIHLAWSGLNDYRSSTHLDRELPAHIAFLERMLDAGVSQLAVAGTCLEYGMQSGSLDESREPKPVLPYAAAKDALRRRLEDMKVETNFRFTWARLFYLYGEGQNKSSLYAQLKAAAARGDRNLALSGGAQLRDYLPVEEAARLIVELALSNQNPHIVNVCSGEPVSVRCLTEKWVKESGSEIFLDFGRLPYNDYEPMEFWGDRSKLDRYVSSSRAIAQ